MKLTYLQIAAIAFALWVMGLVLVNLFFCGST